MARMIDTHAYVNGMPLVADDPLGLWQFTIYAGAGLGGEFTIGNNGGTGTGWESWFNGQWNFGFDVGAGFGFNGSCYRSAPFRQACQRMQLKHHRTRPYTPRTNGKAERFIQTALREWVYAKHWPDSDQRDQNLQPWTDYYNHQRPHGSLSYMPPISRCRAGTTS